MGCAKRAPLDPRLGPKGRVYQALEKQYVPTAHQLTPRCAATFGQDIPTAGGFPVPQTKAQPKPGSLEASTTRRLLLVLLIRFVVALLTALTRLLRLLAGLVILAALLLAALARVLRLLTRLLIVATLILLAALVWIVH